MFDHQLESLDDLRRIFGQIEQGALFDRRAFGSRLAVGLSQQDLLVDLFALCGLDTLDMHNVYRY